MQSNALTITEIADNFGVSLRTLRFYEQRGLLNPVRDGTRRFYTEKDRIRLELILKGKRLGFTLSEIELILSDNQNVTLQNEHASLPLNIAEVSRQVEKLEQRRNEVTRAICELQQALQAKA